MRLLLAIVVLTTGLFGANAKPARADPLFQMPFPCGESWYGATYSSPHPGHSSNYGPAYYAIDWNLSGQDFGRPVEAGVNGTASVPAYDVGGFGHWVIVQTDDPAWSVVFAHLKDIPTVTNGQRVSANTPIGEVGTTHNQPSHLHYEQRLNGKAVPAKFDGVSFPYTEFDFPRGYQGVQVQSRNCDHNPVGTYDGLIAQPGAVLARGHGRDPDDLAASIKVHYYLDGVLHERTANRYRPDVGYGNYHGFEDLLLTGSGSHTVCVFLINIGAGTQNPHLGCRSVNVPFAVGEGAKNWPNNTGGNGPAGFRLAYDVYGGAGVIGTPENAVHMDPRNIAQIQDTRGGTHRRGLLVQRGAYPVFIVSGDHRDYLESNYGGSVFDWMGYPYNNNHGWGNGNTQDFDGGRLGAVLLMKGNYVGRVYRVYGGIRHEYVKNGGAESRLGYPVSDEYPWKGEIHQGFEGGWVCWRTNNTSYVVWK